MPMGLCEILSARCLHVREQQLVCQSLLGGLGRAFATLATINHIVPVPFPFLSPGEGKATNGAGFCWQFGFFAHLWHSWLNQFWLFLVDVGLLSASTSGFMTHVA